MDGGSRPVAIAPDRIDQALRRDLPEGDAPRPQLVQDPSAASIGDLENSQARALIKQIVEFISFQRTIMFDDNYIGFDFLEERAEVRFVGRGTDNLHVGLRRDRVSQDFEE
jgi:hypothetical protein